MNAIGRTERIRRDEMLEMRKRVDHGGRPKQRTVPKMRTGEHFIVACIRWFGVFRVPLRGMRRVNLLGLYAQSASRGQVDAERPA